MSCNTICVMYRLLFSSYSVTCEINIQVSIYMIVHTHSSRAGGFIIHM